MTTPDHSKSHIWDAKKYSTNSCAQGEAATNLLESLHLQGDEHLLDVGCGDGKITASISQKLPRGQVLGIDASPQMINFAKNAFPPALYHNLEFSKKEAESIDYQNRFDIVFSSFALQWVSDCGNFFKRANKSLKKEGLLAITVPLNISVSLESAITILLSKPEWKRFFTKFSPGWFFRNPLKYKDEISKSDFKLSHFKSVEQSIIFSSRESFENYVIQWFTYLQPLPQNLKKQFFKKCIDKYLEKNPPQDTGTVRFVFSRLDIIAHKI